MTVYRSDERPFDDVQALGVVISPAPALVPEDQYGLHSGLLYKIDGQPARISHLAWHHQLRDEPAADPFLWADVGLSAENSRFIAAWLALRQNSPSNIPYGIDAGGACFEMATHEFLPPPLGKGLTCATYIVAVFRSLGFPLLLEETWPADRPDDHAWQRAVLSLLRRTGATEDYVEAAQTDVGAKRYRPAEVVGAATRAPWPVAFQDATALAAAVLTDVQNAVVRIAIPEAGAATEKSE
ncbi:hypothetical protein BRAO375_600074 [Bradyrhizobium sp. ORS 375]|uniref:hypothetical protein n=1 Tax=Bradyrhizobium sp. (strain ORS 375) TaxID=566679 RepID=UPI000240864A|nr:hypothetical protein [Bradyrhizobium sp. ORS 375]CCD96501.1 hypothetical protein BRAO375_600074 [Bradyrhizobium sp. ORS 375]